jgi:ketosteroid isomerase-like protein
VRTHSELLLAGYAAWNRDDLDGYLALLHPEVHISTSGLFPDLPSDYYGRERAELFWRQMHEPWETFRVDVDQIEDEGDWAIASLRLQGQGRDGLQVDMRFGMAMRVQDGLAIEFLNRHSFDEAREAVHSARPGRDRARG